MRNVTSENITQAFVNYMAPGTNPRLREVMTALASHLHAFAREVQLTHAEWNVAIDILTRAGEITTKERNEFVLLSDVMGLSSLVDMINSAPGATTSSVLGPFHVVGAPDLPFGGDLRGDNSGETLIVSGIVRDTHGNPIKGAVLDIWQTADNALYSSQDPEQDEYNLRARQTTGADGRYLFSTVRPVSYKVPVDGPMGELLDATGRNAWRPSHLHFIVIAPGYRTLVTEVFPVGDPYLDQDAVFGVREDLIMVYTPVDRADLPNDLTARDTLPAPMTKVDFDFILKKTG